MDNTAWMLVQCLYVVVGGQIAPVLVSALFARDRAWGALGEAVPTFAVVIAVIALRPMLLLLVLEAE